VFILLAAWVAFTNAAQPILTVWIMVGCLVFFNICDALAGVSWFDMLSRALSARMRGRVVAIGQFAGSVLGLGAGLVIQLVFAPDGLPFPQNYAFVFLCGWAFFNFSLIAILFLKELPMTETAQQTANEAGFGQHLRESLMENKSIRQVLIARGLTSLEAMAAAFYLVFITNQLNLPDESVGTFTIAAIVGGGIGIALFGAVSERFGTRRVAQIASALQLLNPLMALLVAVLPSLAGVKVAGNSLAYLIFILVMANTGAIGHSLVLGFLGYLIDISSESHRAVNVGIMNTMGGVIALGPVIGGVIIDLVGKVAPTNMAYAVVFGLVTICTAIGFVLSLRLPAREVL
jgi:MFS family permease